MSNSNTKRRKAKKRESFMYRHPGVHMTYKETQKRIRRINLAAWGRVKPLGF